MTDSGRPTRKDREEIEVFRGADCVHGTTVGEVCRKAGISEATYYYWRKKYAGLTPSEMKRLRQLEEENGKLKKIVADLSLDNPPKVLKPAPTAAHGGSCTFDLASEHSTRLPCAAGRTIDLPPPLPVEPGRRS